MESKQLLISTVCLIMLAAEISVQAMSAVNTDFERYLRTMNSSTTVPKIEERSENFIFAYLNYTYDEGKYKNYTEEKARYGEGQILNVQGLLVHVTNRYDPSDDKACSSNITGTLGNPLPHLPWIALVRRGECTFEEKVKHVYDQGAVGVIIFNDKLTANLEKMRITDKTRNITAVITYKDVGEEMAAILDQGYEVVTAITRGRSGIRPVNSLNKTSVLFVSISFIVLMIISLVWLIFYYIQRFRYLQSKDQQSRHLCSVTKRAIMKIPTKTGKGNDKDSDNDCCAICIEVYKSSDCIRVLPCNHEFHKACIDPWLIEHRTCPMCKLDVLKYYGYVFIGSEECVMELEGSYFDDDPGVANLNPTSNTLQPPPIAGNVTFQIDNRERGLQNFNLSPPTVVYRHELPDRSQSSLSFVNNNQFFCAITNRLEAQHGIVRPRKLSRTEDTEALVDVVKKRRSHSADSRFSQSCAAQRDAAVADRIRMPSTSRQSRLRAHSPQRPSIDIKIQINGEGVEI